MTIRAGEPWGEPLVLPRKAAVAQDDAELARLANHLLGVGADEPLPDPATDRGARPVIGLVGGDLHRTLGSPNRDAEQLRSGAGMGFPMDLGLVTVTNPAGTSRQLFAAHLVATSDRRGRLWKGRTVIVMNAAFRGIQNLAPRGHPNDGRLDVLDGQLGLRDRRRALERAPAGAHVPHPSLHERRVRSLEVSSPRPLHLWADGVSLGSATGFTVNCLADALTVVL